MLRPAAWVALLLTALPAIAHEGHEPDAPSAAAQISSGDRRLGPFTRDTYPSELSYRPLTLPAGLWRIQARAAGDWFGLTPGLLELYSPVAGAVGLTDRLEISAATGVRYYPAVSLEAAGLGATYLVADGQSLDLAVRLEVELGQLAPFVQVDAFLGLPGRLLLADGVFLTFGDRLLHVTNAPGPLGLPFELALPVGAGFQVASSAALLLGTDLLRALASSARAGGPSVPLELATVVALSRNLDLGVRLQTLNVFRPLLFATVSAGVAVYL